jgi:hypothetical protein
VVKRAATAFFVVGLLAAGCGDPKPVATPGVGSAASSESTSTKPTSCESGWKTAAKPSEEDRAGGISAVAYNDVWAVASAFVSPTTSNALIEHWDGQTWRVVPGADVGDRHAHLAAIAAISTNDAWAVGSLDPRAFPDATDSLIDASDPLIEHWDGHQWTVAEGAAFPDPIFDSEGRGLTSIAVVAANDIWVRGAYLPVNDAGESISLDVFEHWDGHAWTRVDAPNGIDPNTGTAAAHTITADASGDVWAAGGKATGFGEAGQLAGAFVERWDGSAWTTQVPPAGSGAVGSLAVAGREDVWAIANSGLSTAGGYGSDGPQLLVHWDGASWSASSTPSPDIWALAARAPNDVWAAGQLTPQGGPLIEHWDGTAWQVVDTHPPASFTSSVATLSVAGDGSIVAFGADVLANGQQGPNRYLYVDCP